MHPRNKTCLPFLPDLRLCRLSACRLLAPRATSRILNAPVGPNQCGGAPGALCCNFLGAGHLATCLQFGQFAYSVDTIGLCLLLHRSYSTSHPPWTMGQDDPRAPRTRRVRQFRMPYLLPMGSCPTVALHGRYMGTSTRHLLLRIDLMCSRCVTSSLIHR